MGNPNETNSMEMQEPGKDSISSLDRISDEPKSERAGERHVAKAYPVATDAPSLRRLFSFAQLLAFSLTFMESWEVMAMYVPMPSSAGRDILVDERIVATFLQPSGTVAHEL
ncbi:hypothetical protein LTS17_008268 [Exophiala oligosperma]